MKTTRTLLVALILAASFAAVAPAHAGAAGTGASRPGSSTVCLFYPTRCR